MFKKIFLLVFLGVQGFCLESTIKELEKSLIEKYALIEKQEYDNDFIGIYLMGRLGNHFFHLATGLAYAWDHNLTPLCPQLFGNLSNEVYSKLGKTKKYIIQDVGALYWPVYENLLEKYPEVGSTYTAKNCFYLREESSFLTDSTSCKKANVMAGMFFNEKYFLKYKDKIKELFQPSERMTFFLTENYPDLYRSTEVIGIHYRDFTGDGDDLYMKMHRAYYIKALKMFEEKECYVFSNNLSRAQEFFLKVQKKLPEKNFHFIQTDRDYVDFYLLSSLKNIIICNSTFSWWAAYLSPFKDKKIVSPNKDHWFKHKDNIALKEGFLPVSEKWICL